MPFGAFHWYDLIPLIIIALLFFGPKRLPEMGSAIGKTIKEFQKSMREVTSDNSSAAKVSPSVQTTTPELSAPSAAPRPELSAPTTNSTTNAATPTAETTPESAAR
jgi:sec-independent protein translocase protein TatA